jgi:hypothetical protein
MLSNELTLGKAREVLGQLAVGIGLVVRVGFTANRLDGREVGTLKAANAIVGLIAGHLQG